MRLSRFDKNSFFIKLSLFINFEILDISFGNPKINRITIRWLIHALWFCNG